jgi:hypothetical protein
LSKESCQNDQLNHWSQWRCTGSQPSVRIFDVFWKWALRIQGKELNSHTLKKKATTIAYRKASMKTKEIIAYTGCNTTTIICILAASRALRDQGLPQRDKGSGRPRKVTNIVLKTLKRQIDKYPYMTAGQLRATFVGSGRPVRPQCPARSPE